MLRIYPSIPVYFRDATKDTTLFTGGGSDGKSPIFVPKAQPLYTPCTLRTEPWSFMEKTRQSSFPNVGLLSLNSAGRICHLMVVLESVWVNSLHSLRNLM